MGGPEKTGGIQGSRTGSGNGRAPRFPPDAPTSRWDARVLPGRHGASPPLERTVSGFDGLTIDGHKGPIRVFTSVREMHEWCVSQGGHVRDRATPDHCPRCDLPGEVVRSLEARAT